MTIINNKIILPELATDPATPDSAERTLYAKADGLYTRDSAGKIVGPMGRPFKVYVANFTPDGTNAPNALVYENTFVGTLTVTRADAGQYVLASTVEEISAYVAGFANAVTDGDYVYTFTFSQQSSTQILIMCRALDETVDLPAAGVTFEIRVYPSS